MTNYKRIMCAAMCMLIVLSEVLLGNSQVSAMAKEIGNTESVAENVRIGKQKKIAFGKMDTLKVKQYVKKYNIPKEVEQDLLKEIKKLNGGQKIKLVVPTDNTMETAQLGNRWSGQYTYTFKKKKYKMKDYYVELPTTRTNSQKITKGTKTQKFMKGFTTIGAWCVNAAVGEVSATAGLAVSVFELLLGGDSCFTSSRKDYLEAIVEYSYTKKYTYVWYNGQWVCGAFTSMGKLKTIEWTVYLQNANALLPRKKVKYNKTFYSPNYNNSKRVAVSNLLNPWSDDGISCKIGDKRVCFY